MDRLSFRGVFRNDSRVGRQLDGDDDEDTVVGDSLSANEPKERSVSPNGTKTAYNTGPKGVREDARAFEASKKANDTYRRNQATINIEKQAHMTTTWSEDQEEEDAKQRWVEKRMKELSKQREKRFGRIEEVDSIKYLAAVESPGSVCVLVFDESEECDQILEALNNLAPKYPSQRFIRMHRTEADMDAIVVPTVLAYEDGNLVANIVRIIDEIPSDRDVDKSELEKILVRSHALQTKHRLDPTH